MEIKKVWSVNCLLCWNTKWRRCSLGWGIELCGSSSCLEGLRSLLNTEGILTLPMFLLSDGSLIWMWGASFAQQCRVLLYLSIIVKSLSSAFGCFLEMWWFLMAQMVWFLWSEILSFRDLMVSPMYSAVQLSSGLWNWNIKSLLMHPKDPIPDGQKTDIIYHWKCPANNCIAESIGETNRSLKERISDHRNQTTCAIRNHHSIQ